MSVPQPAVRPAWPSSRQAGPQGASHRIAVCLYLSGLAALLNSAEKQKAGDCRSSTQEGLPVHLQKSVPISDQPGRRSSLEHFIVSFPAQSQVMSALTVVLFGMSDTGNWLTSLGGRLARCDRITLEH
jgi:hypothetical protein